MTYVFNWQEIITYFQQSIVYLSSVYLSCPAGSSVDVFVKNLFLSNRISVLVQCQCNLLGAFRIKSSGRDMYSMAVFSPQYFLGLFIFLRRMDFMIYK